MATITVSDSLTLSESVGVANFSTTIKDNVFLSENTNVQIDLGFLHCYFSNDNLNDIPYIFINGIELYDHAARNLDSFSLARNDGVKMVNAQYGAKSVLIDGFIAAPDRSTFETARDRLMKTIEPQEAILAFSQSGAMRNYTATLSNTVWNEKPGGGFATFSLQFNCSDPFGYDTTTTTDLNAVSITTQPSGQNITAVSGSYKALPKFTMTLTSGTGLTNATISLSDQSSNTLSVSRTWVANDVLVVDSLTKTVTVNGVAADYSGVFPVLNVGDTHITYYDGLTTRSVSLTLTHFNRYK